MGRTAHARTVQAARHRRSRALPREGLGPILAGAGEVPLIHEAWLVKFDTTRNALAGTVEQAYALMARAAGMDMPPTRLLQTQHGTTARRHFAVKRFDREPGVRIHHHTLAAICQTDGGDLTYERQLRVTRQITQDEREVWRAYRRSVFNVCASNRDDHDKNHGFLYQDREWRLGPAYDLTYWGPHQLLERGMSISGERIAVGKDHLLRLAQSEALDRSSALAVIDEVMTAIASWPKYAEEACVPAAHAREIACTLNLAS